MTTGAGRVIMADNVQTNLKTLVRLQGQFMKESRRLVRVFRLAGFARTRRPRSMPERHELAPVRLWSVRSLLALILSLGWLARPAPGAAADTATVGPAATRKAEVATGAKDPKDHWAFKAPVKPSVPKAKNQNWVRTPIDNFILARLDEEKLKPSPEADKITLLRRLSLDLIGLPPTTEEVDAFLSDKSPGAYEKQVERMLKSPHYGERWARHWLDAARYADSDGFEKDKSRQVWFYRDYVIDALNKDRPYDQFIIEQLAGDLLPGATQGQIVAPAF